MDLLLSSVAQGFLWAMLGMGVYLTFRILDMADMSAEGTFPLGGAVSAVLIVNGMNPILATLVAMVAGALAGAVTGLLHTKMKIPTLLSGVLVMTGLYSINLRVMGKANLPLLGQDTVISLFESFGLNRVMATMLVGLIFVSLVILALVLFVNTSYGLGFRATGDNNVMAEANGIKTESIKVVGYMLSNGLIALSGALIAQSNGYADVGMGTGTIVIGLASFIIAEVILRSISFGKRLVTIVIGSIIYRVVIDTIMQQNILPILPSDIRILSSIALALILWSPEVSAWMRNRKAKQGQ
ncbi:ABC transporter permease [Aerococcus urinaehominis]|uniref:ABC transporter permease n=1 Tax=Aerococcus urinaehominis TaxID=128944 RepID=A0A109RGL8_9LACT|nr:ABC transporter permease [Aerococcus urinaehominis]AMB99490.1 ABC transporter permease [Aerococcus urinaehominis]SDM26607.1 putative ABC transport system permease protein [Aerococcus urinaehominis]